MAEKASETVFGHVKIGGGLTVNNGLVSLETYGNPFLKVFDIAGTYSWRVPAGITNILVTVLGASGGGGASGSSAGYPGGDGGTGGVTSIGTLLSISGGGGGIGGNKVGGGKGGVGSGSGGNGTDGPTSSTFVAGKGGSSILSGSLSIVDRGRGGDGGGNGGGSGGAAGSGGGGGGADTLIDHPLNVTPSEMLTITIGEGGVGGLKATGSGTHQPGQKGSDGFLVIKCFQ